MITEGLLIAIEGIDGSGKSTLAHHLAHHLTQKNYPVLLTKEPGATPLGQHLRTLVQEKKIAIFPVAEFLLFAADRAQHFAEHIIPALQNKKIVISDRMADSSIVYQGYGRGLNKSLIENVNTWAMQGIKPDVTIYVKVPASVALQRILKRNIALTSFEKEKQEFIDRLILGFDDLYKNKETVITIDGTKSEEEVTVTALEALSPWITKKLHS